jgi:gluconokinase
VIGTGGALRESPLWRQLLADALGHPLVAYAEVEASARGAGLLALEAVGVPVDLRAARTGAAHEPLPAAAAALAAARERQEALYRLLINAAVPS